MRPPDRVGWSGLSCLLGEDVRGHSMPECLHAGGSVDKGLHTGDRD